MHAPEVGSDAVRSAVHAAQSHYIVNDIMVLSCAAPGYRSGPWVHTARCVCTTSDVIKSMMTLLVIHIIPCVPTFRGRSHLKSEAKVQILQRNGHRFYTAINLLHKAHFFHKFITDYAADFKRVCTFYSIKHNNHCWIISMADFRQNIRNGLQSEEM